MDSLDFDFSITPAMKSSAVLLARGLLVVYQARERVRALSGATRGERATHNDNERL